MTNQFCSLEATLCGFSKLIHTFVLEVSVFNVVIKTSFSKSLNKFYGQNIIIYSFFRVGSLPPSNIGFWCSKMYSMEISLFALYNYGLLFYGKKTFGFSSFGSILRNKLFLLSTVVLDLTLTIYSIKYVLHILNTCAQNSIFYKLLNRKWQSSQWLLGCLQQKTQGQFSHDID